MDELSAGATEIASAIAGDALADTVKAAEFFDVDVDQLAGNLTFIAANWPGPGQEPAMTDQATRDRTVEGRRPNREWGGADHRDRFRNGPRHPGAARSPLH